MPNAIKFRKDRFERVVATLVQAVLGAVSAETLTALFDAPEEIRAILDAHQNIVVMKISANNAWMAEELEARGLEKSFVLVSNIGMETQQVVRDIEVLKGKIPYLSTLLIKKNYPLQ